MSHILQTDETADRYVILERIGGGGMGRIYRGIKKGLAGFEKPVVLKQLLPEFSSDPDVLELFFREAHIHAALEHANIVHIMDFVSAGRDFFIVMEYVQGTDLYHVLKTLKRRNEPMPLGGALYVARELFKALDYAHTRIDGNGNPLNIVHRDISPTNILVSGAGEVKITDFGIAKSAVDSTGFVNVRGKIAYMSPEQAKGMELDHRTDIYSAGIVMYEMIAGRRPLPSIRRSANVERHFRQPIEPLWRFRPRCPRSLDRLIRACLDPEPDRRPATAAQVLSELERITNENALFYSSKKLSDFLKRLLGPDPAAWSRKRDYGGHDSHSGVYAFDGKRHEDKSGPARVGVELTSVKGRLGRRGLPSPQGERVASGVDRSSGAASSSGLGAPLPPPPDGAGLEPPPPPPPPGLTPGPSSTVSGSGWTSSSVSFQEPGPPPRTDGYVTGGPVTGMPSTGPIRGGPMPVPPLGRKSPWPWVGVVLGLLAVGALVFVVVAALAGQ